MVDFDGLALGILVVTLQIEKGARQRNLSVQPIFELSPGLCQRLLTFTSADVGPG